eukprot:SAG22_NODE_1085_length_5632_cov_40.777697_9_plen_240_part_00
MPNCCSPELRLAGRGRLHPRLDRPVCHGRPEHLLLGLPGLRTRAGRQAGRQADRQTGRQAGRRAGGQAGRQAGRQTGRQADRRQGKERTGTSFLDTMPVETTRGEGRQCLTTHLPAEDLVGVRPSWSKTQTGKLLDDMRRGKGPELQSWTTYRGMRVKPSADRPPAGGAGQSFCRLVVGGNSKCLVGSKAAVSKPLVGISIYCGSSGAPYSCCCCGGGGGGGRDLSVTPPACPHARTGR